MINRAVILTSAFLLAFGTSPSFAKSDKPNVLLIAVDDLNDWVSCLGGHSQTQTPNIDRLAARGVLFTNAHCQGTMYNPSRISLLWGRRPSSTGFYDNHDHISKEPEFLKTHVSLPAHFAASGYKTLTAGKVFHSGATLKKNLLVVGPRPGQWLKGLDKKVHELLSIYPTLVDLCGLPAKPRLEGVSLRPLLEDPKADWKHVAVSTLGHNNHAVRDERWRYIRHADGSVELYDHQTDPNVWKNLAAESPTPAHAKVIAQLKKHLPKTNAHQRGEE